MLIALALLTAPIAQPECGTHKNVRVFLCPLIARGDKGYGQCADRISIEDDTYDLESSSKPLRNYLNSKRVGVDRMTLSRLKEIALPEPVTGCIKERSGKPNLFDATYYG